jgi:hypothetical protein
MLKFCRIHEATFPRVQALKAQKDHLSTKNYFIPRTAEALEEALDRTQWRTRFGSGYGPVVRQTS